MQHTTGRPPRVPEHMGPCPEHYRFIAFAEAAMRLISRIELGEICTVAFFPMGGTSSNYVRGLVV